MSNSKQQNDDAIIHLETYTSTGGLIVTKAPNEKTFVGRAYCMSALSGGGGEFNTVVQNIFKATPDDSIIQCTMVCAPDHEAPQRYAATKNKGGDLVNELVQRQAQILQGGLSIGWQPDVPLINTRKVIITLSVPVKSTDAQTMADNLALQNEFLNGLKGCGFYDAQPIAPGDLLGWYRVFTNIFEPHKTVTLDDQIELKYQAFGSDTVIDFSDVSVGKIGSVYVAGVAVKQYPEEISHGIMSLATGAPFNHGSTHEGGGQRILTPFLFNTTIRVANQQKENDRVAKAIDSRMHTNTLPFRLGNEDPAQKLKDLQLIKQVCAADGDKYVNVTTTAFLFSTQKEQAQDAAVTLKGTLNKLGFDARETRINTHIRWAQILPLNFSTKVAAQLKSDGLMYSSAVGALMPILGDNPGLTFTAGATHTGSAFITRRGAVHYFDPFVSDNNYSGVIAASPGSGKSFVLQKLIQDNLAEGGYVFLLESGASTKKFCNAAGGEFNEFSLTEPNQPSLNPFTGLSQKEFDEQQETITSLLLLMSYEGEAMQAGARIAMAEAVRAAYAQNEHETEIRHVVAALLITATSSSNDHPTEVQSAAANLVPRLNAFLGSPSRGQFFQGVGTINPTKFFTVFELGGLAGDLHLFKCVTFFVLNLLLSRIRKLPGVRKCVYVDEAHDVFKDPLADKVMEGLYLKGRKEKVSIFCVVQSLLKMAREGAGQVILNSSAWKILLAQKAEEVDQLFSSGTLKQWAEDDFYRRSVKDLETRKGVYSELLISGDRYYETVRLYVDKFTGALFSSEGDARDAVFQLMRGGMSAVDSVLQIMGDKRVSHLAQIKRTVQFLRDLDPNLSPSEIMSMTHEAIHA